LCLRVQIYDFFSDKKIFYLIYNTFIDNKKVANLKSATYN